MDQTVNPFANGVTQATWNGVPPNYVGSHGYLITDITTGNLYLKSGGVWNLVYDKGTYVLAQSAVPASVTGTSTPTTLASITVPAGALGPNGCLRITTQWSYTNNANAKSCGITFGGVSFMSSGTASTAGLQYQTNIRNRGASNSQVGYGAGAGAAFTATGVVPVTSAIDTTQAQVLNLLGTLGTSTDTLTLEGCTVEILNP